MSTDIPTDPLFLSAADVGKILGLRKSRVYELAASGAVPTIRLSPRRALFSRRGIEPLDQAAVDRALGHDPG